MKNNLSALNLALAGGIWLGLGFVLATIAAILGIPGFGPAAELLNQFYGPYGYSVTWLGVIIGGFWGFAEGFTHLGILALIYNWINKKNS